MRAKRTAAATKQIDARRAVTRGAGTLLAVHFLAGAVDVGPVLYFMGPAAALRQLPHHTAVDEVGARLRTENGMGQGDRAGLLAVERGDFQFHVTRPLRLGQRYLGQPKQVRW